VREKRPIVERKLLKKQARRKLTRKRKLTEEKTMRRMK